VTGVDFGLVNEATGFRIVEMVLQAEDTSSRIQPSALIAGGQQDYGLYCATCHGPGASVGKSAMMAGWGGTLSDQQILGLVAFMRSLAEPPYSVAP